MSIKLMTLVWESSSYKEGSLLVLLALADYANDDGVCFPSIPTLAKKCRMDDRSIQRILRKFEKAEILHISTKRGRNHTNIYRLNVSKLKGDTKPPFNAVKDDNMSPFQNDRKGDIENIKGDIENIKGDTGVTQTIIEPSKEPSITHTPRVRDGDEENRVCVSENFLEEKTEKTGGEEKQSFWKSEHTGKEISDYAKAQTPQLGNGWITEAIKTGLYDDMISEWHERNKIPELPQNGNEPNPEPEMSFQVAAVYVNSVMQHLRTPEELADYIDSLNVSEETRAELKEKFVKEEVKA